MIANIVSMNSVINQRKDSVQSRQVDQNPVNFIHQRLGNLIPNCYPNFELNDVSSNDCVLASGYWKNVSQEHLDTCQKISFIPMERFRVKTRALTLPRATSLGRKYTW